MLIRYELREKYLSGKMESWGKEGWFEKLNSSAFYMYCFYFNKMSESWPTGIAKSQKILKNRPYSIGSVLGAPYLMHNIALFATYGSWVIHTICLNLSPAGYVAAGLPLAPILFLFYARRRGRKVSSFGSNLLFLTGIVTVGHTWGSMYVGTVSG